MKTITVPGHIHAKQDEWADGGMTFYFMTHDDMKEYGYAHICAHTLTFEVPDTFNMTAEQIKMLEAQREKAFAAYSATARSINAQISKLQAIEFDASSDNPAEVVS